MATKVHHWTRADLEHLPDDGNRYEVLNGALLVTPQASFDHQYVAMRIATALALYCEKHQIGYVVAPGAVPAGKNELQPDVQVIPYGPYPQHINWDQLPVSLLVVEIRSDSTYRRDIGDKRVEYQRVGIREYWVIDPEARLALVWKGDTENPAVVADVLTWRPRADVEPLKIPLGSVLPPIAP